MSGFSKNEIVDQPKSTDSKAQEVSKVGNKNNELQKVEVADNPLQTKEDKKTTKKTSIKNFSDSTVSNETRNSELERPKQPKFIKSPKSFENRRQGKLTISQALDDDNEKVRSLAAIKKEREKGKASKCFTSRFQRKF